MLNTALDSNLKALIIKEVLYGSNDYRYTTHIDIQHCNIQIIALNIYF